MVNKNQIKMIVIDVEFEHEEGEKVERKGRNGRKGKSKRRWRIFLM
jgi:uncharacterized protein Veg